MFKFLVRSFFAFLVLGAACRLDGGWRQIETQPVAPQTSRFDPAKTLSKVLGRPVKLPSDHVFVVDEGPHLDTACRFNDDPPFEIAIPVTRYVGRVSSSGTLENWYSMVAKGLLSDNAILTIAAYDVDSLPPTLDDDLGGQIPQGELEEYDPVFFNGHQEAVGALFGENNRYSITSFSIHISDVKFPEKGSNGSPPNPVNNTVKIKVDQTIQVFPSWGKHYCTKIDWVALSFETVSPIVMIHGNSSDPEFFFRHGFSSYLRSIGWPIEGCRHVQAEDPLYSQDPGCVQPIQLLTGPTGVNGLALKAQLPPAVKVLGVDSVHLVVHSKGGLDSREYLAKHHRDLEGQFEVLSLTTLSTPHDGSVGADVLMAANTIRGVVEFSGFPAFTQLLASMRPINPGTSSLTVETAREFNRENVAALPRKLRLHLIGADADQNGSESIDQSSEWEALRLDDDQVHHLAPFSRLGVDRAYQVLRNTRGVRLSTQRRFVAEVGDFIDVTKVEQVETQVERENDVNVTVLSAHGEDGRVQTFNTVRDVFIGAQGRNHSSVADNKVAQRIVPTILLMEQYDDERGDIGR